MKKVTLLILSLSAFFASSLCVVAAAASPVVNPTVKPAVSNSVQKQAKPTYRIRATDVLVLSIFQEPDFANVVMRVASDGSVNLPLISKVEVGGLTLEEATQRITELYKKDYFVNPEVTMFISDYAKQRCYVNGWVKFSGTYEFPLEEGDTMTITKVIAGCGGFNSGANRTGVIVKRKFSDGKEQTYNIDVKAILTESNVPDFPIIDGDFIEVKQSTF